ncbi:MAG: hypothetical protein IPL71_04560 [Anaerolineales bacterium]|uniref:hypothetical protein n=1 Tax=Candidatus Villigracilis proximus TaxID=3140683 RepID=UPI0031353026|nr:hypothetical protein [Anaerolineales bacterium]
MEYWNEGDRTFAFWDDDEYFYPATILSIEGDDISIRFDTGKRNGQTLTILRNTRWKWTKRSNVNPRKTISIMM